MLPLNHRWVQSIIPSCYPDFIQNQPLKLRHRDSHDRATAPPSVQLRLVLTKVIHLITLDYLHCFVHFRALQVLHAFRVYHFEGLRQNFLPLLEPPLLDLVVHVFTLGGDSNMLCFL